VTEFESMKAQKKRILAKERLPLVRANTIIDCLRIFYPNQVERVEKLVDYAMKTEDNKPIGETDDKEKAH